MLINGFMKHRGINNSLKAITILFCIALLFCIPAAASDEIENSLNASAESENEVTHNGPCGYIFVDYPVESLQEYYESMGMSNPDENPPLMMSPLQSSADTSYDLRDEYAVTSVKQQGDGGTCWMYSVIGAAESSILKSAVNAGYSQEYVKRLSETLDLSEIQAGYFFYNRNGVTAGDVPYKFRGLAGDYVQRIQKSSFGDSVSGNAYWLANQLASGINFAQELNSFRYE